MPAIIRRTGFDGVCILIVAVFSFALVFLSTNATERNDPDFQARESPPVVAANEQEPAPKPEGNHSPWKALEDALREFRRQQARTEEK